MLNIYLLVGLRGVPPGEDNQTQMHLRKVMVGGDEVGLVIWNAVDELGVWLSNSPGLHCWVYEVVESDLGGPLPLPVTFHPGSPIDEGQNKLYNFPT